MNGTYGIQRRHPLPHDLVGTRLTLAADCGSQWQHIAVANRLANPDLIHVGHILKVPIPIGG